MLFADDTNVLLFSSNTKELMEMSEKALKSLYTWFCCNKLTLNIAKTNYCIFHTRNKSLSTDCNNINFGNELIHRVSNVRYLGMMLDEKLEWRWQIENIINRLVKVGSTLKFLKNFVPYKCKRQLYYAHVYSKILYGIEIYGSAKKQLTNKLQVLQNRILKILYNKDWYTGTNALHKELHVLKVEDIFKLSVLNFVYKCNAGLAPEVFRNYYLKRSDIHKRNTRNVDKLEIPMYKTFTYGHATLKYIGTDLYNGLPREIVNVTHFNKFKANVKCHLMGKY